MKYQSSFPSLNHIPFSISALEAAAALGGEGLMPFYGLLEGGRDGELFAELEDYFYYAQIRRSESFIIEITSRFSNFSRGSVATITLHPYCRSQYTLRLLSLKQICVSQ